MLLVYIFVIFLFTDSAFLLKHKNKKNHNKKLLEQNARNNPTINDTIVQIEDGKIQGKIESYSVLNGTYYSFQGIPYAKPPLGNLRFQPPKPNEKWNDTLLALTNKSACIQLDGSGSEDCLYINVFTPSLTQNLSVMVWIYGGGFYQGDSSQKSFNPELLVQENVVYVSFNYRLGVFGFISTDDLVAPGNAGLKDQVLALKWVQKNVAAFGGNPGNVTIFGESAGAASVSYLTQSPITKNLFHAAIIQSGSSLCEWALSRIANKTAFDLGRSLNVDITNSSTLIKGLQAINATLLNSRSVLNIVIANVLLGNIIKGLVYAPVKEPIHEGALFTNKSWEMQSNGDFHRVPMIIGHTSQEALAVYSVSALLDLYLFKYNLDILNVVPVDMNINNIFTKYFVGILIKLHYFGLFPIGGENVMQFLSDDSFNRPITKSVQLQSKFTPVYFYIFSYDGPLGSPTNIIPGVTGVGHAQELPYIFSKVGNISAADLLTRRRMVRLWTNFAKFGNPTPNKEELLNNVTWYKADLIDSNNLTYLNINATLRLNNNPNYENLHFYDNLYKTYGNPPFDTY